MKKVLMLVVCALVLVIVLQHGRINYLEKYNLALQSRNNHQAYLLDECNDELSAIYGTDYLETRMNER